MKLKDIIEAFRTNLVGKPYGHYTITSEIMDVLTNLINQNKIDPKGFCLNVFRNDHSNNITVAFMDKNYSRYPLFVVNVSKKKGETHYNRWGSNYTDYSIKNFTLLQYNTTDLGDADFDDVLTKAIDKMNAGKKREQDRFTALHDAVVKIKEAMGYEKEYQVFVLINNLYDKRYNDIVFPNC